MSFLLNSCTLRVVYMCNIKQYAIFNSDRAGQLLEAKQSPVNASQCALVSVNRARLLR